MPRAGPGARSAAEATGADGGLTLPRTLRTSTPREEKAQRGCAPGQGHTAGQRGDSNPGRAGPAHPGRGDQFAFLRRAVTPAPRPRPHPRPSSKYLAAPTAAASRLTEPSEAEPRPGLGAPPPVSSREKSSPGPRRPRTPPMQCACALRIPPHPCQPLPCGAVFTASDRSRPPTTGSPAPSAAANPRR